MKKLTSILLLSVLLLSGCDTPAKELSAEVGIKRLDSAALKMEEGSINNIKVVKNGSATVTTVTSDSESTTTQSSAMTLAGTGLLTDSPRLQMSINANVKQTGNISGSEIALDQDGTLGYYYVDGFVYYDSNTPDGHVQAKIEVDHFTDENLFNYDLSVLYAFLKISDLDNFDYSTLANISATEHKGETTITLSISQEQYLNYVEQLIRDIFIGLGMSVTDEEIALLLASEADALTLKRYEVTYIVGSDGYLKKTDFNTDITTNKFGLVLSQVSRETSLYTINESFEITLPDVSGFTLSDDIYTDFLGFAF